MKQMESVEVPHYFICPISLQIMKDPVTAVTGITYDRPSIEKWLFSSTDDNNSCMCPVTNQPLPRDSDLTPNHTLRRLIQAWCTTNAVDRIPTPRAPLDPATARSLLLNPTPSNLHLLLTLSSLSHSNRRSLLLANALPSLLNLLIASSSRPDTLVLDPALSLLLSLSPPPQDLKPLVSHELLQSLTSILHLHLNPNAILFTSTVVDLASPAVLERLPVDFFRSVASPLPSLGATSAKAALRILLASCPWGRNRTKMVEAGAVTSLIELELNGPDRRRTELALGVLDHLCGCCAEGRAKLVGHAAGLAVVAKRILRVSPAADEAAVGILTSVCKHSATKEVLQEMATAGAVAKLCFVLQADCASGARDKAKWVLRTHAGDWKDSSCISLYLLTR